MATSALPETVFVLSCPNGSEVFLVGTSHFSKESAEDVRRTINQVRPQMVVVELCHSRQLVLMYSEDQIREQAGSVSWQKTREVIKREGLVSGLTQLIFFKISSDIMEKLGVAPGGEFRAAYAEAVRLKIPICLGDRQIEVTFKRMLYSLSLWQQFRFTYTLLSSALFDSDITAEDVEKMKDQDIIALLTGELAAELSTLTRVFINERDIWLAHSLMTAANCCKAPYGPPVRIVGVVGMGHVTGIKKNWMDVHDISNLLTIPQPSMISTVFWAYVRFGIQSLFTLGVYLCGRASLRYLCNRFTIK